MDLEKPLTLEPKFTFTAQLTHALRFVQQRDGIQPDIEHKPTSKQTNIDGNLIQHTSDFARFYQTRDLLIFAFISWDANFTSTLTLYYFSKSNGENQSRQIQFIKGKIISMEFTYPFQVNKQNEETSYEIKLVMGNEDGFLKMIDFRERSEILSFQIDTKAIVDIKVPSPESFANHPVCFVLLQDFSIYTVSLKFGIVVAHFRPTIMMCDASLSLNLHYSMKYLLQTTKGGYLILWKINQNLFKKLKNEKMATKSTQKIYNIFPSSIMQAASIQGIKWVNFIGDFIAFITTKGIFKIIALNIDEKQQYAVILEYQIKNGDKIKDAKIFPKQQCLLVVKAENNYNDCIECIFYSPQLLVTHLFKIKINSMPHIDQMLLSKSMRYLFLRNKDKFFINLTTVIENKLMQNKAHNDTFRAMGS